VKSHIVKPAFKNKNSRSIPTGKGVRIMSHIVAHNFSTVAPKITTLAPMLAILISP
jgi:hypothetical protein